MTKEPCVGLGTFPSSQTQGMAHTSSVTQTSIPGLISKSLGTAETSTTQSQRVLGGSVQHQSDATGQGHGEMLDRGAGGGDTRDTSVLALPCTLGCSGNPADSHYQCRMLRVDFGSRMHLKHFKMAEENTSFAE